MPTRALIGRSLALVAFVVATGCEASTAPAAIVAEYALLSIDAQALPVAVSANSPIPGMTGVTVISDTVRLRADGTGSREMRFSIGSTRSLTSLRNDLQWRANGDSLLVSFTCGDHPRGSCLGTPPLEGVVESGLHWVIPSAETYDGATAVYLRIWLL